LAFFFGFGGFGIAFRLPGVPGGGGGVWSNALMLPSRSSGSLSRSRFAITPRESDRSFFPVTLFPPVLLGRFPARSPPGIAHNPSHSTGNGGVLVMATQNMTILKI
jgi:hypothetical protein